jgi:hypothetical protein
MAKALVLLLLTAAACGGSTSANTDAAGGGGGGGDAAMMMDGGGSGSGSGSGSGMGSGSGSNCTPLVTTNLNNGHHHPGEDCMNACHNHGFKAAGTLYKSATGTTPMIGATITLTDSAGTKITMISQSNGNFYTSQPISYPVTVSVSGCPNNAAMTDKVQASGAGCNQGGACHGGTQGQIHLP